MPVKPKNPIAYNPITDTDSYKLSHWLQYPPNTTYMMSYLESRGGPHPTCTLFGLQYLLHKYLSTPVSQEMVDEATTFAEAHGEPFNREAWQHIVDHHQGKLPVRIRAIPEGTLVPTGVAVMTVESTDPKVFWLVSWLETMLVRLWYPSTIATSSAASKGVIMDYLYQTGMHPSDVDAAADFKLHDFGARGVSCLEQSQLGGAAHLLSFKGSDTIEGVRLANHYYDCEMAGFSVPASEHSTMTMWGKSGEKRAYENMVDTYLTKEGGIVACVSDSYDIFRAVEAIWCQRPLLEKIKASGGTLVIRPDSGDPATVLLKIMTILENKVGMKTNSKGFKELPSWIRILQGDGVDRHSLELILRKMKEAGYSANNFAFGSGGGLLQKVNRDTQKWAFKCCAATVEGLSVDVCKDPVTDPGKRSKAGRLDTIQTSSGITTILLKDSQMTDSRSIMHTVYENGAILVHTTLDECRTRIRGQQ